MKERHIISSLLKLVNLHFQNGGKLLVGVSLNVNIYVMRDYDPQLCSRSAKKRQGESKQRGKRSGLELERLTRISHPLKTLFRSMRSRSGQKKKKVSLKLEESLCRILTPVCFGPCDMRQAVCDYQLVFTSTNLQLHCTCTMHPWKSGSFMMPGLVCVCAFAF